MAASSPAVTPNTPYTRPRRFRSSAAAPWSTMTTLVALVVVLMIVVQQINDLFTLVKDLFGL